MAYCTAQDIIDRLSATGILYVADDDGNGVISSPEAQAAIDSSLSAAFAEIDAALAGIVPLPLLEPSDWLRHRAIDLACERIAGRKGNGIPTSLVEAARRSRAWLDEVQRGTRGVPGVVLPATPTASGGTVRTSLPRVVNPSNTRDA